MQEGPLCQERIGGQQAEVPQYSSRSLLTGLVLVGVDAGIFLS